MVQSWIRQALRASGVAILVPAAIVAAIAVSVVGGGGSARSLGQVLSGPAVPPAEAAQPPAEHARREVGPRLRGLSPQSRVRLRGLTPQSRRKPVISLPDQRRPVPPASSAPPAFSPPPSAAPAQPPAPTPAVHPVHDTGTQVADTVRPLPVAGPVAADAVQAVVDLVDPPT